MSIEGVLGKKIGMLQLFDSEGRSRGVTAIEVGPCTVTQLRTQEKDGYTAVQLGYGTKKRLNKPDTGHQQASGSKNHAVLGEFGFLNDELPSLGDVFGADVFEEGGRVDVTATSKGRGFAGTVKRHCFHGGTNTHGQSDRHRAPGSIGAGTTPGRVFKGTRMAGHMGSKRSTVLNLEIVQINTDRNVIFVAGSVPGPNGVSVRVRKTLKGRVTVL